MMKLKLQATGFALLLTGLFLGLSAQAATSRPDVIVKSLTYSPAKPKAGDSVVFTVVIQNIGKATTPRGATLGVGFSVNGQLVSWSDNYNKSLAAGASVTLTANGGPLGVNYYKAIAGSHQVVAYVNDDNYFAESNTTNNKLAVNFTVSSVAPSPTPTPTPSPTATPKPTVTPSPTPTPSPSATPTPPPTSTSCAPAPTSSLVVNVKDKGAKGDGVTNDTAAIQTAINLVSGTGGTVFVPSGKYMIDAVKQLNLGSNMTFQMDPNAILQVITNSAENYAALYVSGSNVNIVGGKIIGDRATHKGTTGEYGMGVLISGASNVYVDTVQANELWGDGFYIGQAPKGITICNVVSDHNRRQGLSIVGGDSILIKNSSFTNTDGTNPQSGIDIEPNTGETATNIQILNSKFTGNHFYAIELWGDAGNIQNVTVDGNTMVTPGDWAMEILGAYNCKITNNYMSSPAGGVLIDPGSKNITVTGNTIVTPKIPIVDNGTGDIINNNH